MKICPFILLAAVALSTAPAGAELVVLTDGRFFKVSAFELAETRMRLELFEGGVVTLPMARIERIVDDEVMPEPEPLPVPEVELVLVPPSLELGFLDEDPIPQTPFGELIHRAAAEQNLNPRLVAALIRAESAFQSRAISRKGARGLMQLMPATAERFGVRSRELYEPWKNLVAGTRYLSFLVDRYQGDLPRILAAYNAGEGAVDRYGGVPPYRETRTYVRRIFETLELPYEPLETSAR